MQLMTFNSLLMFDIVFVFFLFLVGVTCLVYYLPPATRKVSQSAVPSSRENGAYLNTEDFEGVSDSKCYKQHFCRYQCCHRHNYHLRQSQKLQQSVENNLMANRSVPINTCSSITHRSYGPVPATSSKLPISSSDENQMNMEVFPDKDESMIKSHECSRHLYHNILNSAFDHEDDEYNMIATNVQIVTTPGAMGAISTSLPASPTRIHTGIIEQQHNKTNTMDVVVEIEGSNVERVTCRDVDNSLPIYQSGHQVVGICQYHMQQHIKNHHQQHQPHQRNPAINSVAASRGLLTSASSFAHLNHIRGSIRQDNISSSAKENNKVQYIVVDTTTDRSNNRLTKYCHVKARDCDITQSVGSSDPV